MENEEWPQGENHEPWRIISRELYWTLLKELALCTRLDFEITINQELPGTLLFPPFWSKHASCNYTVLSQ